MFLTFFYLLRAKGLKVSMGQWMTLMNALEKGLAASSLTGFYELCRSVLVNSEADFDKLDLAFAEFFEGVKSPEDLPEAFWAWLENAKDAPDRARDDKGQFGDFLHNLAELRKMFEDRKEEQKERHDCGTYWIGTAGTSVLGHGGIGETGIRVGGSGVHSRAVQVAGERNFKDFRQDTVLDIRQFQLAFRKLRQYSARMDVQKSELDIGATVAKTSENAGMLNLVYEKPRKNTVKLLVLFDGGGSMHRFSALCNRLFTAVSQEGHFKDLKFYYFHNCVYDKLYKNPTCKHGDWVDTTYVMNNLGPEYKVIFVGDASMSFSELEEIYGASYYGIRNQRPGIDWLRRFRSRYEKSVWFNPIPAERWNRVDGRITIGSIRRIFPMYELTIDGLDAGIKNLLVSR
jgi:uncharacterized protein with von Willebrand factor type A (vWA) domain